MDADLDAHTSPTGASDSCSEYLDAECGENNDYFEDIEKEGEEQQYSIICEIRNELDTAGSTQSIETTSSTDAPQNDTIPNQHSGMRQTQSYSGEKNKDLRNSADSLQASTTSSMSASQANAEESSSDCNHLQDADWRQQKKHILILSSAGKPIYSLHGTEEKLATLCGIVQALVSVVQNSQDAITSIHANGIKFVFLVRNSLILVAVSRTNMSVQQMHLQLCDAYNQILFLLTYSYVNKIFEQRKNYDLRRELPQSDRSLIHHLLSNDNCEKRLTNNVFTFLTNSTRVLPMPTALRSQIGSAIQSNCSKIKNLVFAVLIGDNKLISLVRLKKYSIHPADLRLIFNLVEFSVSMKTQESWRPICLPKFDQNGFLYAHISYLAEDCQACLLLLSVDRETFFTLSEAKRRIVEKLHKSNALQALSDEMAKSQENRFNFQTIGVPELRHFLYKPRALAQVLCPEIILPYNTPKEFERLQRIYGDLLQRIHNGARPLKLIYEVKDREVALAWVTATYEMYAVFEPLVDKTAVIKYVDKLIKWIDKEYDVYFIRNHPNF